MSSQSTITMLSITLLIVSLIILQISTAFVHVTPRGLKRVLKRPVQINNGKNVFCSGTSDAMFVKQNLYNNKGVSDRIQVIFKVITFIHSRVHCI